jgi:hypothetical protein
VTARTVVLEPADIVTLLLALDMLSRYATTQRAVAVIADNKLKAAAMQAMLDHIGRLRIRLS